MAQKDRLLYFDARGRAEPIRMLYALAEQPLADERISDFRTWRSQIKQSQPLQQLPVLTCQEGTVALSGAIAKYVAKKFKLLGSTPWEEALNDMVVGACVDLHTDVGQKIYHWKVLKYYPEPANSSKIIQDVRERLELTMNYIQSIAEPQQSKFIVCDQVTVADVYTYCILEYSSLQFPDLFTLNPWVKRFVSNFKENERIKNYLATRPASVNGM